MTQMIADAGARLHDLVAGPPFTATLVRLAADDHVLVLRTHHLAFDDWSVAVFRRQLAAGYVAHTGADTAAPSVPATQPADFAASQRQQLAGAHGARQPAYWRDQFAGAPWIIQLPVDNPDRPAGSPQPSGQLIVAAGGRLGPDRWQALTRLASAPVTVIHALAAGGLAELIHPHLTGDSRWDSGWPTHGRPAVLLDRHGRPQPDRAVGVPRAGLPAGSGVDRGARCGPPRRDQQLLAGVLGARGAGPRPRRGRGRRRPAGDPSPHPRRTRPRPGQRQPRLLVAPGCCR